MNGRTLLSTMLLVAPLLYAAPVSAQKMAIVGGFLIDGNGGPPILDAVVLIEGDRITHVGTVADTEVPGDAKVVNANGYSVLPGLNDCHVHLMIVGHGRYDQYFPRYRERMREIMPISARQLLMHGVTSARDVGGPLEESIWLKNEIESGRVPGPRLFVSGPFIQKTARADQDYFRTLVNGADDARMKTRRLINAGVDLIKVTQADQLTPEERRAIASEAKNAGLHIAAHGYTATELQAAVEMGANSIEHVNARPLPEYPEESVRLMAENGVYSCFTSVVSMVYDITEQFPARLDRQVLKDDLPPDIYDDVRNSLRFPSRLDYFKSKRELSRYHAAKLRQLYNGGVRIVVGSDSGTPMNFHYDSTINEMELLVEYGMPPMDVIISATRLPAELYGKGRELGTIEPGKYADVIVVDGNPLVHMNVLKNIVHVIKNGVQYK